MLVLVKQFHVHMLLSALYIIAYVLYTVRWALSKPN